MSWSGSESVSGLLQPPSYRYGRLKGPWIERYFHRFWLSHQFRSSPASRHEGAIYLPIQFDAFFLQAQCHKYQPAHFQKVLACLRATLAALDPDRPYFTVLGMYDFPIWDWHLFPRNVVVFSAAGGGDIPIPLLPGHLSYSTSSKDIFVSFMGSLDGPSDYEGVRSRMYQSLKEFAFFGKGPNWREVMRRSVFSLCPRGQAPASFRMYEAMALGSIPIYLWEEKEWLPYRELLNWNDFSISLPIARCHELPAILSALSAEQIATMQSRLAEVVPLLFHLDAVCRYVIERASTICGLAEAKRLTDAREF